MKLLALDPGVTTGYALFEVRILDGAYLVEHREWGNLNLEDLKESLLPTLKSLEPDLQVIMEKIPLPSVGKLGDSLRRVLEYLHQLFPDAIQVAPGSWKYILNFTTIYPLIAPLDDHDHPPTQHQKDAFYLGVYYIAGKTPWEIRFTGNPL